MKHILFFTLALCLSAFVAKANGTDPDTVLSVKNANNVIIVESPEGMKVTVKGNDSDEGYQSTFEEKYTKNVKVKSSQWFDRGAIRLGNDRGSSCKDDIITGGFCVGMVEALGAPGKAGFELGKSFEISFVNMLAYRRKICENSYLSIGFGMDWRTYRNSKGTTQFMLDDGGKVVCGSFPNGTIPEGSQIKVVRAGFPVMWHQYLGNSKSNIKLGVIFNMTTHASLKSKWMSEQGNKVEQYDGDINTRFFTIDLMAIYKFNNWIGVYGRWTPQSVLRTSGNNSPEFSSLSFGISTLF